MPEPLAYALRLSARACRPLLRVLPGKGLEVVLPCGMDPALVPHILNRHRDWIARALARLPAAQTGPEPFPFYFFIRGGAELVRLRLGGRNARLHEDAPELFGPAAAAGLVERELPLPPLAGDIREQPEAAFRLLRTGFRGLAEGLLLPQLAGLAETHCFRHRPGRVGFRSSRWGSCSSKGGINLNAALAFLPDRLIRHVLLHELCHLKELNHSERYWKLLFAVEPDALERDRELRRARVRWVPVWAWG